MNKKIYLGLTTIALSALVAFVLFPSPKSGHYTPRENVGEQHETLKGAFEYLNTLRANQYTGVVNPDDVNAVLDEMQAFRKMSKASFPLSWMNAGPDNIGGRTRAILVDRNNPKILYAGGVNGGLFQSKNGGASWYVVNDKFENMAIASICQTPDGKIYFGTGESFTGGGGQEAFTPGFSGRGIYVSEDNGATFERIPTTTGYVYTNKLASHPTKNIVFAATNLGLYASGESDHDTWTRVLSGNARDVVLDKNGVCLAYTNRIYRSTDPTTNGSFDLSEGIPNGSRMVVAFSPTDPKICYVVVVGSVTIAASSGPVAVSSGLVGIYQSKDNGVNFSQIVGKANAYFAPFSITGLQHSQGNYDLCVAVHPRDKERIFIGGIQFAEWSESGGPKIVGNTFDSPFNPRGIHSDKHAIVFDTVSRPMIMYIGSDGGVAKTTNSDMTTYAAINNGYQTTQFYGIAAGVNGTVVGGTQDNNTIYINGKGNTPQAGVEILGGDGFKCEISRIDPQILFIESHYGNMGRTLNAGGNTAAIWDERIKASFVDGDEPGLTPSNIFNTPIRLWENEDTKESKLYYALDNEVWMANDAVLSPNPQWFRIANIGTDPHVMELTPDGSSLFVSGINGSRIYRIDGLNTVDWDTAALPLNTISDSIKLTNIRGNLPSRTITDIEVDDNNPNRVIVTMGNYGNSSFVYVTEDALSADPTWRSIQGGLPSFPVYDAEISVENPNHIILGTEYGIWATQNGMSSTPTWVENNENFPLVPVFEMRQVEVKNVGGANPWRTGPVIYAGTHGRGIFKSNNLLTSIDKNPSTANLSLIAYPNPARDKVSVELPTMSDAYVHVEILNYSGQVVYSAQVDILAGKTRRIDIPVSELAHGNYLLRIEGKSFKATSKFVRIN